MSVQERKVPRSIPPHIVRRLRGELERADDVASASENASRGDDSKAVDTWQAADDDPRHETYRLHPDGTVSRSSGPRSTSKSSLAARGANGSSGASASPLSANPALRQGLGAFEEERRKALSVEPQMISGGPFQLPRFEPLPAGPPSVAPPSLGQPPVAPPLGLPRNLPFAA